MVNFQIMCTNDDGMQLDGRCNIGNGLDYEYKCTTDERQ